MRAAVASLREEPVDSIRVLENGSGPDQVRILEDVAGTDARMHVSVSPVNLGFGAGVNRLAEGVDAADGDVLWILNPDTVVAPGCVAVLERYLAVHPRSIASPLILDPEGGVWFAGGELSIPSGRSTHTGYGRPPEHLPAEPFPTRFMTGAAMATTASTWRGLGGFRNDLFLYWEDSELSVRASRSGVALTVVPEARIMHLEGGSSSVGDGRSTTYYYFYAYNRIRVCSQYTPRVDLLLGRGVIETLRSVLKPLVKEKSARRAKTLASLRGIVSGIRAPRLPRDVHGGR